MDTFGEWLQQQRNHRRLTREEFANRVGCSVAMLRKIEYGERRPSAQIAGLIANCLDIPPTEQETFIKVARGELRTDRIAHLSKLTQPPNTIPAQTASHNNLPVLPTPLIGRGRELEQINQLLRDPQCRLLTLVGPGGIGKTRLAIETALRMQDKYEDGIYFVPLAPVNSSRFIIPVIADSIGFSFQSAGPADPKTQLFSYLSKKQMLLLIDNIEHLLKEPDIELFPELLAMAPKVKLLFTSREPLNLQAEWVFEVQGLPIPEDPQTESIIRDTSIELFIQRARRAHAGFAATANDFQAIVRICRLVDGMPLAIELAAGWVRTLTCEEIAGEIEQGLDFLHTSVRDLPARHRSIRAVFDHSWKLLTEEEQKVILKLSIFQGGFQREVAEQVAEATINILSSLVTKSLVWRNEKGRYDLHELIRQYALEVLAKQPKDQREAETRHAKFYLAMLRTLEVFSKNEEQPRAFRELTREIDNIRISWKWGVDQSQWSLLRKGLYCFWGIHEYRAWYQEGFDQLEKVAQAIVASNQIDDSGKALLGQSLVHQGWFQFRLGKLGDAWTLMEKGLDYLRPLEDQSLLIQPLIQAGLLKQHMGNTGEALQMTEDALVIAETNGDTWAKAWCHCNQGIIKRVMGSVEQAYEYLRLALDEFRVQGDPRLIAITLIYLGPTAIDMGHLDEAQGLLQESLSLSTRFGDSLAMGAAYNNLGLVALAQHNYKEAKKSFEKALELFSLLGTKGYVANSLAKMGSVAIAMQDVDKAKDLLTSSIKTAMEVHAMPVVHEALAGMARIELQTGNDERAVELALWLLGQTASTQETKGYANQVLQEARDFFNEDQIQAFREKMINESLEVIVNTIV